MSMIEISLVTGKHNYFLASARCKNGLVRRKTNFNLFNPARVERSNLLVFNFVLKFLPKYAGKIKGNMISLRDVTLHSLHLVCLFVLQNQIVNLLARTAK